MKYRERSYAVRFLTPAFLGGANQSGEWRTPPFKALLRQWWRVAVARRLDYDHRRIREEEGRLFGHAWLEGDRDERGGRVAARRSEVRIALESWRPGRRKNAPSGRKVPHPEVERRVDAKLYLGYGPVLYRGGQNTLKEAPAIDDGEENRLRIRAPEDNLPELEQTLQLVHCFGTVGGRSRNGWGSLHLSAEGSWAPAPLLDDQAWSAVEAAARPIGDCLRLDWPHALGRDDAGVLVWRTRKVGDWSGILDLLGEIKIQFRTSVPVLTSQGGFADRHLLGYPVTHHSVNSWDRKARLSSQIRLKLIPDPSGSQELVGLIFHLPHRLPEALCRKIHLTPEREAMVWRRIRELLDGHALLQRLAKA